MFKKKILFSFPNVDYVDLANIYLLATTVIGIRMESKRHSIPVSSILGVRPIENVK